MQVSLAVVCDYSNVTVEGKLNILGIFQRISAARFPAVHPQMNLVLRLEVQPAEFERPQQIVIELRGMDGQKFFEAKSEVTVVGKDPSKPAYLDQVLQLNNLVFPISGSYEFVILINNDQKGRVPMEVALADQQNRPLADSGQVG